MIIYNIYQYTHKLINLKIVSSQIGKSAGFDRLKMGHHISVHQGRQHGAADPQIQRRQKKGGIYKQGRRPGQAALDKAACKKPDRIHPKPHGAGSKAYLRRRKNAPDPSEKDVIGRHAQAGKKQQKESNRIHLIQASVAIQKQDHHADKGNDHAKALDPVGAFL